MGICMLLQTIKNKTRGSKSDLLQTLTIRKKLQRRTRKKKNYSFWNIPYTNRHRCCSKIVTVLLARRADYQNLQLALSRFSRTFPWLLNAYWTDACISPAKSIIQLQLAVFFGKKHFRAKWKAIAREAWEKLTSRRESTLKSFYRLGHTSRMDTQALGALQHYTAQEPCWFVCS